MAHRVIVPQKKIMSNSFLNSGTLIVIFIYRLLCCVSMIIMVDMKRVTKILQFSFVQHILVYAENTNVFHIDAELNRITERTVHSTVLHFKTLVFKQHLQYIQYIEMRINAEHFLRMQIVRRTSYYICRYLALSKNPNCSEFYFSYKYSELSKNVTFQEFQLFYSYLLSTI